jgi:hypothetical protein
MHGRGSKSTEVSRRLNRFQSALHFRPKTTILDTSPYPSFSRPQEIRGRAINTCNVQSRDPEHHQLGIRRRWLDGVTPSPCALLRLDAKACIQIGLIYFTPLAAEIGACRGLTTRRIIKSSRKTDFDTTSLRQPTMWFSNSTSSSGGRGASWGTV